MNPPHPAPLGFISVPSGGYAGIDAVPSPNIFWTTIRIDAIISYHAVSDFEKKARVRPFVLSEIIVQNTSTSEGEYGITTSYTPEQISGQIQAQQLQLWAFYGRK